MWPAQNFHHTQLHRPNATMRLSLNYGDKGLEDQERMVGLASTEMKTNSLNVKSVICSRRVSQVLQFGLRVPATLCETHLNVQLQSMSQAFS